MNIDLRFFSYCITDEDEIDICEITEQTLLASEGVITYKRHTVFENGCNQVCLTIEPASYPMECDVILNESES